MKNYILFLVLLFANTIFAQKSNQIIGGNFDMSSFKEGDGDAFSIKLQSNYGYFTTKYLMLGCSFSFDFRKYYRTKFGIGPFIRIYWHKIYKTEKANLFLQYQFLTNINKPRDFDSQYNIINELSIGNSFFLNKNIAIEGILYYGRETILKTSYNQGFFGFRLGFQYYLNRI